MQYLFTQQECEALHREKKLRTDGQVVPPYGHRRGLQADRLERGGA